jgi:phosphatidylserine decarboxylase
MKICLQKWMPQHSVSRLVGKLASCRVGWLKNFFIRWFIKQYKVDMSEAKQSDYREYPNFNAFFTRPLKADARVFPDDVHQLACPVDGYVSELGPIRHDQLFQAKGHYFKLLDLLGGDEAMATQFYDGHFLTAYLSPKDYHRIHMPIAGQLQKMIHVPGDLFSVNPYTVTHVPSLFARNERVVCLFDTDLGPMVIILVGAVIVASIATVWHGVVTPPTSKTIQQWDYGHQNVLLNRGEEMGHFQLGSTAIVLFGKDRILWDSTLKAGDALKMGQGVALKI